MRTLYHLWLSPHCHKVRLALAEKKLAFNLEIEKTWERREQFLAMNPAAEVPVLVDSDGTVLADSTVICEYLDEVYPEPGLIGRTASDRAEARRLAAWFDLKFAREVTQNLVGEKVTKRFLGKGQPDSEAIRVGRSNLPTHLFYIVYLTERRNWCAGNNISLADLAAAAQLSALDYLDDVPWDDFPGAKDWYARIKSRPSFKELLKEHVPGVPPAPHYADLNF